MRIARKDHVVVPFTNKTGEKIYEMIGRTPELGSSIQHSVGHVVIPFGKCSRPHLHPKAEETYYVLSGCGAIKIGGGVHSISPQDVLLISPGEKHQIFNTGHTDLEFLVICAPAWEPINTIYLDE